MTQVAGYDATFTTTITSPIGYVLTSAQPPSSSADDHHRYVFFFPPAHTCVGVLPLGVMGCPSSAMLRHDATNSDGPAGGVMLGILVPVLAGLAPIFQTATLTLVCLQLGLPKNFNLLYMPDLDGEGTPQGLKYPPGIVRAQGTVRAWGTSSRSGSRRSG